MLIEGKVWACGDHVDTDAIIPARFLNTSEPEELALHCMEGIDPGFASEVASGVDAPSVIVAGRNFGCGSSREHAPLAIKAAGVSCVVAKSFARIFYRNAINIGLPILTCPEAVEGTKAGHRLRIDLRAGTMTNLDTARTYHTSPFPGFIMDIIAAGGLVEYTRERMS
ncbi:MAG: 3-isopropylmalate dehydratase small subunit [Anaerolineae bacterium]|nr:3-isopropylmalate dehydratase small subunit [Anaerolineae bacterium]